VARLAYNADFATVQFDNCLGNWQPHTGTLNDHALLSAAVELFKDHLLFHIVNSRPMIGDAGNNFVILQFGGDVDGSVWRRIFSSIVQKMSDDLRDSIHIHSQRGEVRWNIDIDRVTPQSKL